MNDRVPVANLAQWHISHLIALGGDNVASAALAFDETTALYGTVSAIGSVARAVIADAINDPNIAYQQNRKHLESAYNGDDRRAIVAAIARVGGSLVEIDPIGLTAVIQAMAENNHGEASFAFGLYGLDI